MMMKRRRTTLTTSRPANLMLVIVSATLVCTLLIDKVEPLGMVLLKQSDYDSETDDAVITYNR